MKHYPAFEILLQREEVPLLDVRTPAEYATGHVPGAVNLPLFTDEERAVVGTLYVKKGKDEAVEKGLEFVGPKLSGFVKQAKFLAGHNKRINVYCWRGGMRSGSMGWLLETAGLTTGILSGGYKAYRTFIRQDFARPLKLVVLGGMTGSGKTEILHKLADRGEQVLDLEGLANHKGSAFGALGLGGQPTNEMFENLTWDVWSHFNAERVVWVEDESMAIGSVWINSVLYDNLQQALTVDLEIPFDIRVERLLQEYGHYDTGILKQLIRKLERRMGGAKSEEACAGLENGDIRVAVENVLCYYDKAYRYGLTRKHKIAKLESDSGNSDDNATLLQQYVKNEISEGY